MNCFSAAIEQIGLEQFAIRVPDGISLLKEDKPMALDKGSDLIRRRLSSVKLDIRTFDVEVVDKW